MDIKLIVTDMDGTLMDTDHNTVPRRNLDALHRAAGRGVKLAIASGRSWSLIQETAQAIGAHYAITANGGYALDVATGERMSKTEMDRAQTAAVIAVLRRHGLCYELYADGENYVQNSDLEGIRKYALSKSFEEMFMRHTRWTEDMLDVLEERAAEKFDIFYVPPEERAAVLEELAATGPLGYSGALGTNLELTAAGVSKGAALQALCAKLGLRREQVMAFGDADNDLEMLAWAGMSFAMENAIPEVKAAARYATGSNHDGGVGMAVERYVLNR